MIHLLAIQNHTLSRRICENRNVVNFTSKALTPATWPDFAAMIEQHNGVWGGCWCMAFHPEGYEKDRNPEQRRAAKEGRVRDGCAHAALVYAADACIGWCQFGSPEELPRIKFGKAYRASASQLPAWRITCFFVDKRYRGQGVAAAALAGALHEISLLGGGTVESFPEEVSGRTTSASFLHNASVSLFERAGFQRTRQLGKHHWLVTRVVTPADLGKQAE